MTSLTNTRGVLLYKEKIKIYSGNDMADQYLPYILGDAVRATFKSEVQHLLNFFETPQVA